MKIKKNDTVLIISGKDKSRRGKVIEVFPAISKVVVENVNLAKRHVRPKKQGEKGQIVEIPKPISVSNVKLICPKCGQPSRVGYKRLSEGEKIRSCKKCGQEI